MFNSINKSDYSIDTNFIFAKFQEMNAECSKVATNRDVVLVIGNTDSGKSTFVNYLAGCEMMPERLATGEVVITAVDAITEIGHGSISMTSFPKIYNDTNTGLSYCDCPGFLDNRSAEADIINGYTIKSIADCARSVKAIIVMVNFHDFIADKGHGLEQTLQNLSLLLGDNAEKIRSYQRSIKIIVSKCPFKNNIKLDTLRQLIGSQKNQVWKELIENVYFYDPCDRDHVLARGASKREDILTMIQASPIIDNVEDFGCAISSESLAILYDFVDNILNEINNEFDQQNFDRVNQLINILNHLLILEYPLIHESILQLPTMLFAKVKRLESDDAVPILQVIKRDIPCCQESAEVAIQLIQTRKELQSEMQADISQAQQTIQTANQQTAAAINQRQNSERIIEQAEQAKRNAEQLARTQRQLLVQLQQDVADEQARGPRVIYVATSSHRRSRHNIFKTVFRGLLAGTVTGLCTGNPMLGLFSGVRSVGQTMIGGPLGAAIGAIPLPLIYHKPHIDSPHQSEKQLQEITPDVEHEITKMQISDDGFSTSDFVREEEHSVVGELAGHAFAHGVGHVVGHAAAGTVGGAVGAGVAAAFWPSSLGEVRMSPEDIKIAREQMEQMTRDTKEIEAGGLTIEEYNTKYGSKG